MIRMLGVFAASAFSCDDELPTTNNLLQPAAGNGVSTSVDIISLGDSYTAGFGVSESERWPVLLADQLSTNNIFVKKLDIVAKSGWTTKELLDGIETIELDQNYDLVSLLIGVNNQYQGNDLSIYQKDFERLVTRAIDFSDGNPNRVLVLSIPDYSVTEYAKLLDLDLPEIRSEIETYNREAEKICQQKGVVFCNITELSRLAGHDPTLTAPDGLHPSGAMYRQWVSKCYPLVIDMLSNN